MTPFDCLNLGPNKRRLLETLVADVSRRFEVSVDAIWAHPALCAILDHPTLSPLDRFKQLSRQLQKWKTDGDAAFSPSAICRLPSASQSRRSASPDDFRPASILIDPAVEALPYTKRILKKCAGIPFEVTGDFEKKSREISLTEGKKTWVLTAHKGRTVKLCPGFKDWYLCCGYFTFDLISGCPFECSYCVLQNYLREKPATHIYVNVDDVLADVSREVLSHGAMRVGTGELADSLALDPLTELNRPFIEWFGNQKRAVLELKTKSHFVDHLLDLNHGGQTVVAWSVNAEEVVASEEWKTASLTLRLEAAQKVVEAGYRVAFHFDPLIVDHTEEETSLAGYEATIARIEAAVPPKSIAWVSMGGLRFSKGLKEIAESRLKKTKIYTGDFVREGEKFHYPPHRRVLIYSRLWGKLTRFLPKEKLYLCMENPSIWQKVDPSCKTPAELETRLLG